MSRRLFGVGNLAWLSLLFVGVILAEEIVCQVNGVDIHEKKISMSAIVATVNSNDRLQILEKLPDGMLHVKVGDKEGYVKATKLQIPQKGGFGDLLKNSRFEAHAQASDPTASMAARGLRDGAIVYAQAKNYSPQPLNSMIDTRRGVAGTRFDRFTKDGNVGPR